MKCNAPRIILIGLIFMLPVHLLHAQSDQQTIAFIQKNLVRGYKVSLKSNLVFTYSDGGKKLREDKVYLEDLDPDRVIYSSEEKSVIMRCYEGEEKCIDRKLIQQDKRRGYSRLNMKIESDAAQGEKVAKALKHLLLMWQDDDYNGTVDIK